MSENTDKEEGKKARDVTDEYMNKVERLTLRMENLSINEYINLINKPVRFIFLNFVIGLAMTIFGGR